jgi:anti-anti-sigma factor
MDRPYRYIDVERPAGACCVRLRQQSFHDEELEELSAEIARLVDEEGCRNLVLNLGPEDPQCLFSVFLAKLVNLQKRLENDGGQLALANLSPGTKGIFEASSLDKFFCFYPDQETALAAMKKPHA